jgi:hypothetical protein
LLSGVPCFSSPKILIGRSFSVASPDAGDL